MPQTDLQGKMDRADAADGKNIESEHTVRSSRSLWHHPDFLKLWAGESVSILGSQITTLALPLTAVLLLKADSVQLGILNAMSTAPFLFLTLFAGVWIDHQRRRPILLIANLGRALLLGTIPLLAFVGWLRTELLDVIALLAGCLTVFFYLAFQAILPSLVQRDQLIEGNSKLSATTSAAEIGGPGIGGFLIQALSAPVAICADAISFLIAAISIVLIRAPEPEPVPYRGRNNIFREIGEGLKLTFTNRYLRAFSGEAASYNLFWQLILTIFILYAVQKLHLNSGLLGLLFAVGSVGALFGSLITGKLTQKAGIGRTILGMSILSDVALLVLPAVTGTTPGALAILLSAFFLQGIGITGCNVHVDSLRQALIPDHLRGRINASYRLLVSGALPVGALLGGFLGNWIGLQATLLVGTLGLLSTALWIMLSPVPKLRGIPEMIKG